MALKSFKKIVVDVLGLEIKTPEQNAELDMVRALAAARESARKIKDYAAADLSRNEIESHGYRIEDTPAGPHLIKK